MPGLDPGTLDKLVTILRPTADNSLTGAGKDSWTEVAKVYASIEDVLAWRAAERLNDGFNIAARPARVRMHYRADVTSNMRFQLGDRIMRIVTGPAEIGFKDGLEFMVEDFFPPKPSA